MEKFLSLFGSPEKRHANFWHGVTILALAVLGIAAWLSAQPV
jgi:hypothetical protein